jgi:hypothetical protein
MITSVITRLSATAEILFGAANAKPKPVDSEVLVGGSSPNWIDATHHEADHRSSEVTNRKALGSLRPVKLVGFPNEPHLGLY